MKILESVSLDVIRAHEQLVDANVTIGSYDMDKYCPTNEFRHFRVRLDAEDLDRLYLLVEFRKHTANATGLLRDVLPQMSADRRVAPFLRDRVDLRHRPDRAVLLLAADLDQAALVTSDGNHRAMAQFLMFQGVSDVHAFVSVHPSICQWPFVPPLACAPTIG